MKMQWILAVVVASAFCAAVSADTIDTTSGLVYHLDANTGVSATSNVVTTWADTANPSLYSFSQQTTPSKRPTFVANAVNGHAAIEFSASSATQLATSTSSDVQTVILVCKAGTSNVNAAGAWGQYGADMGIRRNGGNDGWYSTNENDFTIGGSMSINGVSNPQKMDGTNTSYAMAANSWGIIVATASTQKTFAATSLGDYNTGTVRAWSGQIAEVAAFNGTLTDAQTTAILSSLSSKYNIAVAGIPEPTSMMILFSGGIALLAYAWRKRK